MIISRILYVGITFTLTLNILPVASDLDDNVGNSLNFANLGCEETQSKVAKAIFEKAKSYKDKTRDAWWIAQKDVWKHETTEQKIILKNNVTTNSSREVELLLERGQGLLNETQQSKLLDFEKSLAILKNKLLFVEDDEEHDDHIQNITSAEDFLRSNQTTDQMEKYWNGRFESFYNKDGSLVSSYMLGLIKLLKEEAHLHGNQSLPDYWEQICEVKGQGYKEVTEIWNKIKPTFQKLSNFVMNKYNLDTNSSLIPPYLLGSFKGDDWSLIVPHLLESDSLDKLNEFEEVLKKEEMKNNTHWAIKRANVFIDELGLETVPEEKIEIALTSRCPDQIVTLCLGNQTDCPNIRLGVALCSSTSYTPRWYRLIEMIEQLAKDAYLRTSKNTCIINFAARYSALETAVPGAVVLRALEGSNLPEEVTQLIIALRTLPALGQALIADQSRISATLDKEFGTEGIKTTFDLYWTRAQRDIFGVEGDETWQTYLVDDNIITNQPSLSEFLGLLLQFRLIKSANLTGTLNNLARIGLAKPWPDALKEFVILEDEKPWEPLLHYLQPLNNIIEKDGNEKSDASGNTVTYACVGVVLLALALGVAWWYWKKHRTANGRGTINSKRGRYSEPKSGEEEGRELQNL